VNIIGLKKNKVIGNTDINELRSKDTRSERVRREKKMTLTQVSKNTILAVLILLVGMLTIPASEVAAQSTGNAFIGNQVATVNGEVMTENELLFTLVRMFGDDTIYDLIEDEIIASQAGVLNVSLGQNDVVEYLAGAYAPEKLSSLIGAFGEDLLTQTVGTQLLALATVTAKIDQIVAENSIEVTEEEVRSFYLNNLPIWSEPASVRFSLIETATRDEVESARQRIIAGESFADVCMEVSTHPGTRAYGGDIGGLVPQGYSSPERVLLENTAFALEIGELSMPLEVDGNFYIITTTEKTEYNEPTFEEMQDYIHARLMDEVVQPYLDEWMGGLFDLAELEITYPIMATDTLDSFVPGQDGSFIASEIGVVNGRSIPEGALYFHLLRQYGSDVIQSMIEEILFVQTGRDMGVTVTDEEIRNELTTVYDVETLGILDAAFGSEALDRTFARHLAALDVMGTRFQEILDEQGIEVSDEEVTEYYLDNLPQWVIPETVRFSIIVCVAEEEAVAARASITNGESFESVCSEVSIDEQTRAYGGDIGSPIQRGYFTGESAILEETAFGLPIGGVSQPFNIGANWFIIKVSDKVDAYEPTLGEMREDIAGSLLQERVGPFILAWRSQLWEAADITVVYPIYSEDPSPDFSS